MRLRFPAAGARPKAFPARAARAAAYGLAWLVGAGCAAAPASAPAASPAASLATQSAAPAAAPPITLSMLGLNDLHGQLRALPTFGGYLQNVRHVRNLDGGAVLLLDAGDMFQGTLESNLTEGASVLAAYAALGVNAAALGNHEFDFGPEGESGGGPQGAIRGRIREAGFPILSANLVERDTGRTPAWEGLGRSTLLRVGGVKLGVIGGLTAETPSIVMADQFSGLDVAPLAPAVLREARELRAAGAELVVLVAHAGAVCKRFDDPHDLSSCTAEQEIFDVARALPAHSVDAIFAGHTHAGVAHVVNGIPIAEAYSRGAAFSRIDLEIGAEHHELLRSRVFPPHELCPKLAETGTCPSSDYEGRTVQADPAVAAAIAPALALADQRRQELLGVRVTGTIHAAHAQESALGNLFADLLHEAVPKADLAIVNGGTLRADLPEGDLRFGQLFECMPFDNHVAQVRVSGAELKRLLEAHVTRGRHGLVSLSGMRARVSCDTGRLSLELWRDNGRRVRDDEQLVLATSDYLATGGDEFFQPIALPRERVSVDARLLFRDALIGSLKRRRAIDASDAALFDPHKPRLSLPSARPVHCGTGS